jgi:hypothetical protein
MLLYLVCWTFLVAAAAAVGSALLSLPEGSAFSHVGDRMIAATWLGLLIIAAVLLGLSVVVPLSPATGFCAIAVLAAIAASFRSVRRDFATWFGLLTKPVVLGLGMLALAAALNATGFVEVYDTGLYHYPLTRWLSTYGTVRGLALIHFRFGFSSSWFALAAPFDFGLFQGRIAAMLGGLASFLCLAHLALAASRIAQGRGGRPDWFLAGGYIFILAVCFSWAFEVSLSPDVPVWILTLLVGWLMLLSAPAVAETTPAGPTLSALIVFLMALCTLTLKPSAGAIVAIAGIFYLFNSSQKWTARLFQGAVACVIAVPIVAANITSSGCPVYPSPAGCLDVPWGVGKAAAREIATDIGDWGRWRDAATGAGTPAGNWMASWITQPDKLALLSLCLICLFGFLLARGWRAGRGILFVLALGLFGTAFLLVNAPNPRFGVGYFALFPAILLAAIGPTIGTAVRARFGKLELTAVNTFAYGLVALALVVAVHARVRDLRLMRNLEAADSVQARAEMAVDADFRHRLLLPPALAMSPGDLVITKNRRLSRVGRLELVSDSSNGIDYRSPKDRDQCWGAALPCVPAQLEGDISLRVPSEGIRSGFVHTSKLSDVSRR